MKFHFLAFLLVTFCISEMVSAQQKSASKLPEGRNIIRNGKLNEHPERAVHWVTRDSGNLGKFTVLPPEKKGDSGILQIDVKEVSSRPWTLELRQAMTESLQEGETLLISFEYKLTPGYAFHCYWQKDSPPWPKFLSIRLAAPENEWAVCAMSVRVHTELAARETSLSFHLAEKAGTVQFRNFAALVYPASVAPEDLETTVDPVFGGDFYDQDWRQAALKRIEETRKGKLKIKVVNDKGPVSAADVKIEQKERDFVVGTEVAPGLLEYLANGKADTLSPKIRSQLQDNLEKLDKFKSKIMNPQLFNQFSPRNMFFWNEWIAWEEAASVLFDKLDSESSTIHGHALYCPAFRFFPPQCRQMEADELRAKFYEHLQKVTADLKGKIGLWNVLHAPLTYDEVYNYIGPDSLSQVFKIVEKESPGSELIFSDDKSLLNPSTEHLNEMLSLVRWLIASGARIDAVALVAEMTRPYIAPQAIEERLDKIANTTNLPIYISALAVESPKEDIQADRLRDLLIAFYSHPAVKGFSLGGIWEPVMERPAASLFRNNFAIKPAGKVFEELLTEKWWTKAQAKTDSSGMAELGAFFGKYEVTVVHGDKTVSQQCHLHEGKEELVTIEIE